MRDQGAAAGRARWVEKTGLRSEEAKRIDMNDQEQPTPLMITIELPCHRCRHILYGLSISNDCPECGLPIEESLRTSIDLESVHGRALRNPRAAAVALIAFSLATATALGAGILVPLGLSVGGYRLGSPDLVVAGIAENASILGVLTLVASIFALVGLLVSHGSRRQFDAGGRHPLRWGRAIGITLASAILAWSAALIDPASRSESGMASGLLVLIADLVLGIGAVAFILALDQALRGIGTRSEQYRRAGRGVQSARPMVTGTLMSIILGMLWFVLIKTLPGGAGTGPAEGLLFIRLALAGLLGVGGIYLLANAIWATAPFWRGPWRYDQIVGPTRTRAPASMADHPALQDRPDR